MNKLKHFLCIVSILVIAFWGCQDAKQLSESEKLANFFSKNSVNIIVTDSGLGGLSVAADVVARIKDAGVFEKVNVVFFNAQPHINSGYNSMKTTERKVRVFNNALMAMEKNFNPDLILIACNTLSVIYEYTEFSKITNIPVKGIVGTGVDLIKQKLDGNKDSKVMIFATKTTVGQAKHKTGLRELGITEDRVFAQACPKLAGRIERGPHSDTTVSLVNKYVQEAINNLPEEKTDIFVSYNCTHYGYVDDLFQKAFKEQGIAVIEFLDPNPFMADFIFDKQYLNRYPETKLAVKVVSQPELPPGRLAAIYDLIEPHSAETAEALFDYKFEPDYFDWQ